ncbi:MAG: DinB family protein [Gemmatimonadales bacterium]
MTAPFQRPTKGDYPDYFETYLGYVTEPDPIAVMTRQIDEVARFFDEIPAEKADFAYAPGKWTIKEVVGHLSDTERVMAYRALSFARGDRAELPGFDENAWVPPAGFGQRSLEDLVGEWASVRRATLSLLQGLPEPARAAKGRANGRPLSVAAIAMMIPGHVRHHLRVITDRYL